MLSRLFNSLRLRSKLLLSFSLVLILFIATAIVVFFSSRETRLLTARVGKDIYPARELADQLIGDFRYIGELYSSAITFKNAEKLDRVQKFTLELNERLARLDSFSAVEAAKGKELSELFRNYLELADRTARAMVGGVDFTAVAPDLALLGDTTRKLDMALKAFQTSLRDSLTGELTVIDRLANRTTWTVVLAATGVILLSVLLSLFMTGRITQPISALMGAMERVQEGNLHAEIAIPGKDEIAALGHHFNTMIAGLRDRERIRDTFKRYVAHSIVDEVLKNPEKLQLGGELRVLTVLFSDLAGFTSLSERMRPRELVAFLNDYFEEMVGIILDHKGTFDKFEGDLLMAFWGAPVEQSDHAAQACFAALAMQKRIGELQQGWRDKGVSHLSARIGINSGEMLVGNLGSKSIMSYTVMGDAVNLASRLESGGKNYGIHTTISELTYGMTRDYIEARELDVVRVQGKEQPIKIYELFAKKGELPEMQKALISQFSVGLIHYRSQRWDSAIAAFQQCLTILPEDSPSKVYIKRCEELKRNSPPEDWDGVYTFTAK